MGDANALAYLAGRGFGRDLLDRQHVGYATGDELVPYLVWRKLPVIDARRVGLLDADGGERLAGRIVPLDPRGAADVVHRSSSGS